MTSGYSNSKFISLILVGMFLQGCVPASWTSHTITAELHYNGRLYDCSQGFVHDDQRWKTSQVALFLSGIQASNQGEPIDVSLDQNDWQHNDVALLFGINQCESISDNNYQLQVEGDLLSADTLTFTLGLPFEINHLNPVTQASPLNLSDMFWSWRNGYKFLRVDMHSEQNTNWSYHLGSLGCVSPASVRAPESPCRYPNTFTFSLPKQADGSRLIIHLDQLLSDIEPDRQGSCMFESMNEPPCSLLADNLANREVFTWL